MDPDNYLEDRLESEIQWYDYHSSLNKWMHIFTQGTQIVCSAIIPLLAGFAKDTDASRASITMGVLGIFVAVSAGFSALLKFQENWIKYRTTAESLKKEKFFYLTKTDPYHTDNPLQVLVQRVENFVSQENTTWAQSMVKPAKVENSG